ncbi:MAG: myxococcus cysteine-rich repeat containing protein [Myxococcota bacterium]
MTKIVALVGLVLGVATPPGCEGGNPEGESEVSSRAQALATREQKWIAATVATLMGISGDEALDLVEHSDPPFNGAIDSPSVPIEKYTDGDDTDWSHEINAFLNDPAGPTRLVLGRNSYHLALPLDPICRQVEIVGQGQRYTTISAPGNVNQAVFHIAGTSGTDCSPSETGGNFTILRDFRLEASSSARNGVRSFGVLVERRATLESLLIDGFANGVRIDGRTSSGTNANRWQMFNVVAQNASHAAIYVDGNNCNAGTAVGVSGSSSCKFHSEWTLASVATTGDYEWMTCAGIVDSSQLGNTWVGAHAASNNSQANYTFGEVRNNPMTGVDSENFSTEQQSICVGCYAEGSPVNRLSTSSVAFGGDSSFPEGGGVWNGGWNFRSMRITTPIIMTDPASTDATPILMRWDDGVHNAHIESTPDGYRGSTAGGNRTTAWEWDMVNEVFVGCGDGTVNGAEECDDGNRTSGDGCDRGCKLE